MSKEKLSIATKNKIGNISAVFTVLFTLFSGWLIYIQSDNALPLILGIGALVYGPLCFIFYVIEVIKGVFKRDEEAEETEEV